MTIDELKENGIQNLVEVAEFEKGRRQGGSVIIPDTISNIIADLVNCEKVDSAIVCNSNFGEISSKLNIENLINIDINPNNVAVSRYLNPNLTFLNDSPLNYSSDKLDCVISSFPFGQRKEVIGERSLHIKKALGLLNEHGTAILILPYGFLYSQSQSDRETRNFIIDNFSLKKIIRIPPGLIRNLGIKLAILEIKRTTFDRTDFYSVSSDFDIKISKPIFSVSKKDLSERWDFTFHHPQNQTYEDLLSEYKTQQIGDLLELYIGRNFKREERNKSGNYKIITTKNFRNGTLEETPNDDFIDRVNLNPLERLAILIKGDILLSRLYNGKVSVYVHLNDNDRYIANQDIIIFRGKNAEYVATYLNTESGINLFHEQIIRYVGSAVRRHITLENLKSIQIPILQIEDLEYASKSKLEKLSYNKLIEIKKAYDLLKTKYSSLKNNKILRPHEEQLQSMQLTLQQVLIYQKEHALRLTNIENKIDDIKTVMLNLSSDFKVIQSLPREVEEKISRLNNTLEEQISNLHFEQKQIDSYIREIKKWFAYYHLLETKSQKYLPEAEYIFDHISKLNDPDFSPFILQYCRALENELLSKIFRAYVQSLLDRNILFEEKFYWDLGKKESGKPNDENTFRLAKHIQKSLLKNMEEWFFELGSMEMNLRFLTGNTLKKSPLLQDLKEFVLNHFKKELLNIEYLDEIKIIIKEYRNQSAHPNLMNTEKAISFLKQMKECLITFMENYKTQ